MSSKKDLLNCDQTCKLIQERILLTEKNFSQIYQIFSEYLLKTSRVRDKCDEISKIFTTYSENEEINKTLSNGLGNFGISFSILGDLEDLRCQKIETKVLVELSQYEGICKNAKEEIKHIFTIRDREVVKRRQLDRLRERNPRNRQQISQAETELLRATAEVTKTIQGLEEQTDNFEKQKLEDIKKVMLNFISIEMAFHAKSLEVLTKAAQEIYAIDEENDLQEFQKMRKSSSENVKKSKLSLFKSNQSLGSLNTLFTPRKSKNERVEKIKKPSKFTKKEEDDDETVSDDSDNESDRSESDVVDKFLAQKSRSKY